MTIGAAEKPQANPEVLQRKHNDLRRNTTHHNAIENLPIRAEGVATHVLWVCCKSESSTSDLLVSGLVAIFLSNRMVFSKFASMCFPCVCAMFGRIAKTCVVLGMRAVDHVPSDIPEIFVPA